jgi:IS4 transposase
MKQKVRLIEYEDENGRFYRVVTTRYDLSAEEIANIYRHCWQIELYFKWMKQHLRLVKLFSYKLQAVWNHLFMALIGHLIVLKLKERINPLKKTA